MRLHADRIQHRHCPKCQGAAAKEWLAEREAELLPVPYFHVVFSLPAQIADIAYHNKAVIYDILFKASAETMITIAADLKHLGARIGILSVLHTWGSALTHHPHVHMIVPGGGISLDGERWIACRPNFFLPVRVLSRLFRRRVLEKLDAAHHAGQLQFFGKHVALTNAQAFAAYLAPLRNSEWVVYSKRPFGGPEEVLRYLARYTHRVAISNRRLLAVDDSRVTFKWKDYRIEGPDRYKLMTLDTHELLRLARQRRPCRQHRARPPDAGRAIAPDRCHQENRHQARRANNTGASMPLLRRPHDHHRDLRARLPAQIPPATTGANQDRHIMTQSPPIDTRRDTRDLQLARRRPRPSSHPSHRFAISLVAKLGRHHARRPYIPQPTPVPPAKTTAATDAIEHPAARSPPQNPHSARYPQHRHRSPPAISCLGAFRTPASGARA